MTRSWILLGLVAIALARPARAEQQTLEVLGTAHTNNRTANLTFRVPSHQARVSEIRIRSGGLAVTLVGVEIEFADGKLERIRIGEALPPGGQSHPIPVDPSRTISRVFVTKQPGLRAGETAVQLLGKVAR